jgi:CHAT domain-containing protein
MENARHLAADPETRSMIAAYFPGLAGKVCRATEIASDVGLMTTGCELRKGRSLLASRADGDAANRLTVEGESARPGLLGERTHYLSYTVLHHDDRVHAVLYTADGHVTWEAIGVRPSEVRRRAPQRQLDPRNWRLSIAMAPLRTALAPLVAPLTRAWQAGAIREGDHVCVAADDPIHLIPLPYLPLEDDTPLVHAVSVSRCTSFSDARATSTAPVCRPEGTAALFLPTVSRALDDDRRRFDEIVALLGRLLGGRPKVADRPMTAPALIAQLAPHHLIHIDAHGTFPDRGDPYRASGLIVSDGYALPVRGASDQRLLAPVDLIDGAPDLTGAHVTLNACVSGRGSEGRGGDLLGLEQALRLCGAASVIASHWDVPADLAATFMKGFYARWPGGGAESRASAWRTTILDMMATARTPADAAECCVFGLFGDWR